MPTINYYTVDDEILGQDSVSGQLDYLTDGLGSIVASLDQSQVVQSTSRYKPYGLDLDRTGVPLGFGWIGSLGYRMTGIAQAEYYVRSRSYSGQVARWRSIDVYWPIEHGYVYCHADPINWVDDSGYQRRQRPKKDWIDIHDGWLGGLPGHEHLPPWLRDPGGWIPRLPNPWDLFPGRPDVGPESGREPRIWSCENNGLSLVLCAYCVRKHNIEDRASESGGADKRMHCVGGCLANILCGTPCPDDIGTMKENIDKIGGGTVSRDDAVATDDGWDAGEKYPGKGDVDKYCKSKCKSLGWN